VFDCRSPGVLLWFGCMLSWRSPISIFLLGIGLSTNAQNPSPWHGRILGIEESYPSVSGRTQSLTYTDLNNGSQRGTLSTDSEIIYTLNESSATIYVFKRKLANDGEPSQDLEIIPLNNIGATRRVRYPPVCSACPGCGCAGQGTRIVVSRDAHYVFTALTRRLNGPGTEQIVVTYDSVAGRFLDSLVSLFPVGGLLLSSSEPESFEMLTNGLKLLRYKVHGPEVQKGVVVSELPVPDNRGQLIRDSANARTLFLCVDGKVIEITDRLKQIGQIDAPSPMRRSFPATISGDGKLLFVPTGPIKTATANASSTAVYIDQIDVYNAASLTRLRTLHSQRSLLDVIPNHDGTMLYAAIPDRPSIVVLDSETLWQEEDHLTQSPIRQITLLP
jgi:hypothetical protein